jgi:homoserine dehydrogenase
MSHYRLALLGFGNVGRAFARLLLRKETELKDCYGITFTVTGIATGRHGAAIDPAGLDLDKALGLVESDREAYHTRRVHPQGARSLSLITHLPVSDTLDFIRKCPANVLFENSPVDHQTGQPAIDHLRTALGLGMHAVTANKGPVVHAYRELTELAEKMGRKFYFESTVMDGAPIFSLFRSALPAAQVLGFRGILNSTTNLILTRMENGESFDEAVKYTQSIGLAETDPSADVDGWDAAIKVAALVTVLMDIPLTPQQVERTGIRGITAERIKAAKAEDKHWKLVCSAERKGDTVSSRVAPELVSPSSPLYSVDGSSSIVEFQTDVLGDLSIMETDPTPANTAYGLLADFINAVK